MIRSPRRGPPALGCWNAEPGRELGNPAIGRNRGAALAAGDPIVFLDADCAPAADWLGRLLDEHGRGTEVVGGSLDLPPDLSLTARCDYYCGWYHVHSGREGGEVSNHPPGNLSVRRGVFARTGGFTEQQPIAYSHEELAWQAAVRRAGGRIVFVPGRTGVSPQSRRVRQSPAAQLPMGLQRHREQGPHRCRASRVGVPLPRPPRGGEPADRARDARPTSWDAGPGRAW